MYPAIPKSLLPFLNAAISAFLADDENSAKLLPNEYLDNHLLFQGFELAVTGRSAEYHSAHPLYDFRLTIEFREQDNIRIARFQIIRENMEHRELQQPFYYFSHSIISQ